MSQRMNRREFTNLLAVGATLLSCTAPVWAQPAGTITVRQSAGDKRFEVEPTLKWQRAEGPASGTIVLDPSRTYQEMLGFGAALTDASAYMINELDAGTREKFLHELFHPSELGIQVTRICVGACDFSASVFSYDDGDPDPDMKRFSIDHDKPYILPQLRAARKHNPDLFVYASPWSPPGWMKSSGTMLGGSMMPRHFPAYAKYLVKFLQSYQAEGVPIDALTVQNEVDTDQDGGYPNCAFPACIWAQEHEIAFVGRHLGPAFEQNKISTKIWILDHNFNLWGRAINELENPLLNRYTDGVAWHPYGGSVSAVSRVHDLFPDKSMHWTESGIETSIDFEELVRLAAGGAPGAGKPSIENKSAAVLAQSCTNVATGAHNWIQSFAAWNVVLNESGGPSNYKTVMGGGNSGFDFPAFIGIHSKTKAITRSAWYWALKHYTHAARRRAKRFDSQGQIENVAHVAFVNPDDAKTVVLSNTGGARKVQVRLGGLMAEIALPANSVTNLHWS
jgi:glucosylceramidase